MTQYSVLSNQISYLGLWYSNADFTFL